MMQVFRGRTLVEARRAAEAALGPDAVVLTTRKVPRQGLMGWLGASDVEVAATGGVLPRQPVALAPVPNRAPTGAPSGSLPFSHDARKSSAPPPAVREDLASLRNELRSELRSVRSHLDRMPASSDSPPSPDWSVLEGEIAGLRLMVERIVVSGVQGSEGAEGLVRAIGVEGAAAAGLVKAMRSKALDGATARERLRAAIATAVPCADPIQATRAIITMVGPTGVGKTTTLAKMAARAVLEEGRTATLVSCDTFRVGATDQLRRYAELMGAKFAIAEGEVELARVLREATTDYVFVDNAGGPPPAETTEETKTRAKGSRRGAKGVERHVLLCLPATLRAFDAAHLARAFAPCKPTALVITKLDETAAPAGIVHAAMATKLPVALLAYGPRVPEDIAEATAEFVFDRIAAAAPGGPS
jgi:flagellar biosynthesis protein FlhF